MARRHNFFDFPHKPFRFMWMEVVSHVGNVNYTNEEELDALQKEIGFACEMYAHHNRDESEWFGSKLKELNAEQANAWIGEHDEGLAMLDTFKTKMQAIRDEADLEKRGALATDLYIYACTYLAEDLDHMMMEQNEIMKTFQDAYTDEQLLQMEGEFIATVDPSYLESLTPLFLRAGNIDERTFLLSIVQKKVPSPEAFQGLLSTLVASIVPAPELDVIKQRLGV